MAVPMSTVGDTASRSLRALARLAVQDRSVEVSQAAKLVKDVVLHAIASSRATSEEAELVRGALMDLLRALRSALNDPTSELQRDLVLKAQVLMALILQLPFKEEDQDAAQAISMESLRLFGLSENWTPLAQPLVAPKLASRSSTGEPTPPQPAPLVLPLLVIPPPAPPSDSALDEADELLREFSMDRSARTPHGSRITPTSSTVSVVPPRKPVHLPREVSVIFQADDLLRDLNEGLEDSAVHAVDNQWREMKKAQSMPVMKAGRSAPEKPTPQKTPEKATRSPEKPVSGVQSPPVDPPSPVNPLSHSAPPPRLHLSPMAQSEAALDLGKNGGKLGEKRDALTNSSGVVRPAAAKPPVPGQPTKYPAVFEILGKFSRRGEFGVAERKAPKKFIPALVIIHQPYLYVYDDGKALQPRYAIRLHRASVMLAGRVLTINNTSGQWLLTTTEGRQLIEWLAALEKAIEVSPAPVSPRMT